MSTNINNRMRYTRQAIVTNTFYQMPRFLMAGEFAGNKITNNARILYTLLLDRHRISIKNGWSDDNGEVYIYFKREEMETQLGLSERTVSKVMQELKDFLLVEEKQQGMNKPNKIYLLSPIIGNDETPDPYLEPEGEYNPEKWQEYGCEPELVITADSDTQDLRSLTRNNYGSEPVENAVPEPVNITGQDPQNLRPNYNKLNNNNMNDNERSDTAAANSSETNKDTPVEAEAEKTPYSQIIEMYNALCEKTGLRAIRSVSGKRKIQTAARLAEYGLNDFVDLFEKVSASSFLCGSGERGWKADYDWLIAPTNMQKVLEGKYDGNQSNTPLQQTSYEPYQPTGFSNPQKNNQERRDPFLERAMKAYATAEHTITNHESEN